MIKQQPDYCIMNTVFYLKTTKKSRYYIVACKPSGYGIQTGVLQKATFHKYADYQQVANMQKHITQQAVDRHIKRA